MSYGFNVDKSKAIIKTKRFVKSTSGENGTNGTFTKEQLGAKSLSDITILEIRQAVLLTDGTTDSKGWVIGGRYVFDNQVYPACHLKENTGVIVRGYNWDTVIRNVAIEITYLVSDVEHDI